MHDGYQISETPMSYELCANFESALHARGDKRWCEFEQTWKVHNRMRWYIEKNDKCSSDEPILFPFYNNFWSDKDQSQTATIMVSDEDIAPDLCRGSNTRKHCTLDVDLSKVPSKLWKDRTNSAGKTYKRLDFMLAMQIESGGLRFDLRVEDVVYGEVIAEFQ